MQVLKTTVIPPVLPPTYLSLACGMKNEENETISRSNFPEYEALNDISLHSPGGSVYTVYLSETVSNMQKL